jgi:hypothetical protein
VLGTLSVRCLLSFSNKIAATIKCQIIRLDKDLQGGSSAHLALGPHSYMQLYVLGDKAPL